MKRIICLRDGKKQLTACLIILSLITLLASCVRNNDQDTFRYHILAKKMNLDMQKNIEDKRSGIILPQRHAAFQGELAQYEEMKPKLIASGYLTNLSIALLPTDLLEDKSTRLVDAISSNFLESLPNDFLAASIDADFQSNTVIFKLVCPTQDVSTIKGIVQGEVSKMNSKNRQ